MIVAYPPQATDHTQGRLELLQAGARVTRRVLQLLTCRTVLRSWPVGAAIRLTERPWRRRSRTSIQAPLLDMDRTTSALPERAAVVGASTGGAVALKFARAHPEHVAGLALVGPGRRGFEGEVVPAEQAIYEAMEEAAAVEDLDVIVEIDLTLWVDGIGREGPGDVAVRERGRAMHRVVRPDKWAHRQAR
jgi:pimeloyl-ACP methyl ester carboxylesterase